VPDEDIKLEFTDADRKRLDTLLERLQAEMGKSAEEGVCFAAVGVAKSLGASTRKAPKMLKLRENKPGLDKTHPVKSFPFFVYRFMRDGEKYRSWIHVRADPEQKRRNPRAGLAARSWFWALEDIGAYVAFSPLRRYRGVASGKMTKGANPTVTITNRLRYIMQAVRLGGPRGIETALERGTKAGISYLDRRLAKAVSK
jgi:hypothetical protein